MTNYNTESHDKELTPAEELYTVAREATTERQRVVAEAHIRQNEILRSMTDAEITTLASQIGKHEAPMDGARAVVAVDLIVVQPRLALVIAERHFENCTSYHDVAVQTINDYLHDLWRGKYLPTDENLERILEVAKRQRENYQRMLRSRATASKNWSDGCC